MLLLNLLLLKKEDIVIPTLPHNNESPPEQSEPLANNTPVDNNTNVVPESIIKTVEPAKELPQIVPEPFPAPDIETDESNLVIGDDLGMEALDFDSLDIGGTMNINEDE